MMALTRDAQQWALAAAAILKEWMERMSCSTSCQWLTSHQCSSSHWCSASHRRSRCLGQWEEGSQVTPCHGETETRPESSQMNSNWEGTVDIYFFEYWRTSCQRGTPQEWTQSPSSTRQKHWVTFAEGRVPLLGESLRHGVRECLHDAGTEMGYQVPPLMWQTEATPWEMADWSRPWEEAPTILVEEEDVDLRCLLALEPHLQQLLGEEEPSLAGINVGDNLPPLPMPTFPPQPLPPKDPKPSALHTSDWIEWCARYVQMPSWWEELTKILHHVDHQEFTLKVHPSFEMPKVCNWLKNVDNYHTQLLTNPSIGKHHFLLPRDIRFSTQDICLTQLHHTITYTRALQH